MCKITALAASLLFLIVASGTVAAAEENKSPTQPDQQQPAGQPPMDQPSTGQGGMGQRGMGQGDMGRIFLGEVVPLEGKIVKIDRHEHTLTLQGPEGRTITLKADPKASHYDELKVGDKIKAQIFQGLVLGVSPEGTAETGMETVTVQGPSGKEPSELRMATITMQAKIDAVDPDKRTLTLTGPEGHSQTFKVQKDVNLDKLKPGDTITARYLLGIAIELEKS